MDVSCTYIANPCTLVFQVLNSGPLSLEIHDDLAATGTRISPVPGRGSFDSSPGYESRIPIHHPPPPKFDLLTRSGQAFTFTLIHHKHFASAAIVDTEPQSFISPSLFDPIHGEIGPLSSIAFRL